VPAVLFLYLIYPHPTPTNPSWKFREETAKGEGKKGDGGGRVAKVHNFNPRISKKGTGGEGGRGGFEGKKGGEKEGPNMLW